MADLESAVKRIEEFSIGRELANRIAALEGLMRSCKASNVNEVLSEERIDVSLIDAALTIKKMAGEVNVIIHAIGILLYLPIILEPDEQVEYVSLGAGNTGKEFDLKTNKRIAEFKFINWRKKANTIRQNNLFKDLFYLAEYETDNLSRHLYVVSKEKPMQFLHANRAIKSVLSRHQSTYNRFYEKYAEKYSVVCEYFRDVQSKVIIEDLNEIDPDILQSLKSTLL